jgi:hypothetical protein
MKITGGPYQRKAAYGDDAYTIIANVDGDTDASGSTAYTYDTLAVFLDEFGEPCANAEANMHAFIALPVLIAALKFYANPTVYEPDSTGRIHDIRYKAIGALQLAGISV